MAAFLPAVTGPGQAGGRHAASRSLGRSLGRALARRFGPGELAFSYSETAAFCCRPAGVRAAIDCETLAFGRKAAALRDFFARICPGRQSGRWSASRLTRAWTMLEALAKLAGPGLACDVIKAIAPHVAAGSGPARWLARSLAWRSLPFYGHWLTVAYEADAAPRISATYLPACKLLP